MCGWGWPWAGGALQGVWKDVRRQGGSCQDPCLVWELLREGFAGVCFTHGAGVSGERGCRVGGHVYVWALLDVSAKCG